MEYGILGLIPITVMLILAIWTKRTASALLVGILISWIIMSGSDFLMSTIGLAYEVGTHIDTVWLFFIMGMLFMLMGMLEKIGSTKAFLKIVQKKATTSKRTLMWSWVVAIVLFIDETLSMAVLGTLSPIYDKHKIPRASLAYIGDSTAAPFATLLPFNAWGLFYIGVFAGYDQILALGKDPYDFYVSLLPFMFYAWIAILIAFLFGLGVIPPLGAMKKAYKRAEETGELYSEESKKFNKPVEEEIASLEADAQKPMEKDAWIRLGIFVITILVLTIGVIITKDAVFILSICLPLLFILSMITRIATWKTLTDAAMSGLGNALPVLIIIFCAYMTRDSLVAMGLPEWVVSVTEPYISPALLPFFAFILCCLLTFTTGSNWGITAVFAAIGVPLCFAIGADPVLTCAAIVSGATFGGHICFYADFTVQASYLTKIDNMEHALTQLPYGLIGGGISSIGFLVAGLIVG